MQVLDGKSYVTGAPGTRFVNNHSNKQKQAKQFSPGKQASQALACFRMPTANWTKLLGLLTARTTCFPAGEPGPGLCFDDEADGERVLFARVGIDKFLTVFYLGLAYRRQDTDACEPRAVCLSHRLLQPCSRQPSHHLRPGIVLHLQSLTDEHASRSAEYALARRTRLP